MKSFELLQADKLAQACTAKQQGGEIKAAGIDLLDRLKERVEAPKTVVNLMPMKAALSKIAAQEGGGLELGALCSVAQLERAAPLQDLARAALLQAAQLTATPQVRSRATLGGNLLQKTRCWYLRSAGFTCLHDGKGDACRAIVGDNRYHAVMGFADCVRVHPSNLAPALVVLDARCEVQGSKGSRSLPIRELFPRSPLAKNPEHSLGSDEILTKVLLPKPSPNTRSAYLETREKQSHDWATTAAAVRLRLEGGLIREAAICLGAVAPVPMPRDGAAKLLLGKAPSRELFQSCAAAAFEGAAPLAHNGYKLPAGKAVLVDALTQAAGLQ